MKWTLFEEYMVIFDVLWYIIEPVIEDFSRPERDPYYDYKRKPGGGGKHENLRWVFNTILYVLVTGTQWNSVPKNPSERLALGKTSHKWHMRWSRNGFYHELAKIVTIFFDTVYGLKTTWCSLDGCIYKAQLAVEAVGKNPTDRGRNGTKRSLIVEEEGLPIGFFHEGANVHDSKLLKDTLLNIFFPSINEIKEKHLCLDAAYVGEECRKIAEFFGFIPHVQPRGDEKKRIIDDPSFKARRWVVERTHQWFKCFKKLSPRNEKTVVSHDGLTYLASIVIIMRTIFRSKEKISPWKIRKRGQKKPTRKMYQEVADAIKKFAKQTGVKYYSELV